MPWLRVQDVACCQGWRLLCPEGAGLWGLSQSFGWSGAAHDQAGCSGAAENANAGGLGGDV